MWVYVQRRYFMKQKGRKTGKMVFLYGLLLILIPFQSFAQQYPTRPINLLVVYAPGGTVDVSTRVLASKAEKFLGKPIIISNKGGGGGSVALGTAKNEKPDGYHLVACTSAGLTNYPTFQTLPYTHQDFAPIVQFVEAGLSGLVVKTDSPWKTLKDVVEFERKNPGKFSYGTIGVNSPQHLVMAYVGKKEGIQWTHVPFEGGAPAIMALLGGHISGVASTTDWVPHVKEGSLRLLATFAETRVTDLPDIPNVPTVRELGYDITSGSVFIIAAPKGTPPPIVKRLDEVFHKAMGDPEFIQAIQKMQFRVKYGSSEDTEKYLNETVRRLRELVRDLKIPRESEKK